MNYLKHYCGNVPSRQEYSILNDAEYEYMIMHQRRENRKMLFFSFGFFIFVCVFFPVFIACLSLSGNKSCNPAQPVQAAKSVQAAQHVQASYNSIPLNYCVYNSSGSGRFGCSNYEIAYKDVNTNQVRKMIINLPRPGVERDKIGGGATLYTNALNPNESVYLPCVLSVRKL